MKQLVLSLFPGIGLLDMAFEEAGFCVVRGPDLLWGGDVRSFHPPAGRFDGVIGGPPCKCWSPLSNVVRAVHGEESVAPDLIPEFERVVTEARPMWFLMENVTQAPAPRVSGYTWKTETVRDVWCGGETNRLRNFTFGVWHELCGSIVAVHDKFQVETLALHATEPKPTVTTNSGGRRKVAVLDAGGRQRGNQGHADHARLNWRALDALAADQGVPPVALARLREHGAFTSKALRVGLGNGVPLPMGRAVASAVVKCLSSGCMMEAAE